MAAPFTAVAEGEIDAALVTLAGKLPATPPLELMFDLQDLATAFAAIAATQGVVSIRLEAITGRGCHRWHADAVGLRLLCTYRGLGTEWLARPGGAGTARALAPDRSAPIASAQMPAGSAAILKGEGHPGNAGAGCIHRAPPAGTGARARLLLCIDEPGRIPSMTDQPRRHRRPARLLLCIDEPGRIPLDD
ncbi:DUF1826 domain-containing protein [Siccirubricoccus deserti]